MVKIIRLSTWLARTCTTQHSTNSCYTNHYNFHTWEQQIAKLLYFTLYEYWPQRPSSSQLATLHELSFCPFSSAFLPSSSIILAGEDHLASCAVGWASPVMLISKVLYRADHLKILLPKHAKHSTQCTLTVQCMILRGYYRDLIQLTLIRKYVAQDPFLWNSLLLCLYGPWTQCLSIWKIKEIRVNVLTHTIC